jgi:hypothetical protein
VVPTKNYRNGYACSVDNIHTKIGSNLLLKTDPPPQALLDYFLHEDLHFYIRSDDLGTASSFGILEVL